MDGRFYLYCKMLLTYIPIMGHSVDRTAIIIVIYLLNGVFN